MGDEFDCAEKSVVATASSHISEHIAIGCLVSRGGGGERRKKKREAETINEQIFRTWANVRFLCDVYSHRSVA
jgi:hypothetical protein